MKIRIKLRVNIHRKGFGRQENVDSLTKHTNTCKPTPSNFFKNLFSLVHFPPTRCDVCFIFVLVCSSCLYRKQPSVHLIKHMGHAIIILSLAQKKTTHNNSSIISCSWGQASLIVNDTAKDTTMRNGKSTESKYVSTWVKKFSLSSIFVDCRWWWWWGRWLLAEIKFYIISNVNVNKKSLLKTHSHTAFFYEFHFHPFASAYFPSFSFNCMLKSLLNLLGIAFFPLPRAFKTRQRHGKIQFTMKNMRKWLYNQKSLANVHNLWDSG